MSETEGTAVSTEALLTHLQTLPWCKQGEDVLVAVAKATPDIVDHLANHSVKMFPGGMTVKMQKSVLTNFKQRIDEEQPLPVVIVWRPSVVEVWYRKNKPDQYPYDAWSDPAAAAHEQEIVLLPAEEFGAGYADAHAAIVSKVKACPSMMPPY